MASTRRRGITAAVTALLAMALAAAVAGRGCHGRQDGPTEAVRAFLRAAADGNRDQMLGMLGPKTLQALSEAADRATGLVGGEGRFQPRDMLQPMAAGPTSASIANLGRDGDIATVSVTSVDGSRVDLSLVRVGDRWLIELPIDLEMPPHPAP